MPFRIVLFTMPAILRNLYKAGKSWHQQLDAVYADTGLPWSMNYAVGFEENN
jgi:hypothetical protein